MSKSEDLTKVVAGKTAALYASGNERQQAIFEALTIEKAIERGENPVEALALVDALRLIGAGLNEGQRANAQSKDKAVEARTVETSIEQNLIASGKSPDEIALTLGELKNTGAFMAGVGISLQGNNQGVTAASPTPAMAVKKTPDLPDH
jgi:hypothetical protein